MPQKLAVVVGNDGYPTAPLSGCINDANAFNAVITTRGFNDAQAMADVLKLRGFTSNTLLNANKAPILAALNGMVDSAIPGNNDKFIFFFSGHGSQVRDVSGDEADGWDEVICPIDWPQYISDDDLRAIFARLPSDATLDVFMDCCHSGTGTRDVNQIGTIRALPPIVGKKSRKAKAKTKAIVLVPGLNHILWAGCRDGQTSAELIINGQVRGAFSYYLCKALTAVGTRSQMINYVCTKVAALGLSQVPQLEATQAETLQAPFT